MAPPDIAAVMVLSKKQRGHLLACFKRKQLVLNVVAAVQVSRKNAKIVMEKAGLELKRPLTSLSQLVLTMELGYGFVEKELPVKTVAEQVICMS